MTINSTPIYCKHCGIVPLPKGHIEMCRRCIEDIVEWLSFWDLHTEHQATEQAYMAQFTLDQKGQ